MLAYGVISLLVYEKRNRHKEIDKEIIRKKLSYLFIKDFFLNIINIGVLGFWLAIIDL
jgi:hypothetical protein